MRYFGRFFLVFLMLFSLNISGLQAQTSVFSFLDLPVSSRVAALGGKNVSLTDQDINFAFQNPALLSRGVDNSIGLNMANYLADIKFGTAIYSRSVGANHFALGVQFVDYGVFKETTEFNEIIGEFGAQDIAVSLIYSRELMKNLTVGAALKPVYSAYERYTSYGAAVDLGVSYAVPEKYFSAGLSIRNMGAQIKGYYMGADGQHYEPLPFDIRMGISKKLKHAPFRYSVTLHNLHRWDLNYIQNNSGLMDYERTDMIFPVKWLDMAFRHTVLGLEFLPGKNFYLAASYNHRRHQELRMNGFKSMAGFSFGGGIKISKFQIGFGMSQFQVGNYSYLFSVSTSLSEFRNM